MTTRTRFSVKFKKNNEWWHKPFKYFKDADEYFEEKMDDKDILEVQLLRVKQIVRRKVNN